MGDTATGSLVRLTSGLESNTKLNRPSTRRCLRVEYACCHPFSFVVVIPRIIEAHVTISSNHQHCGNSKTHPPPPSNLSYLFPNMKWLSA